MKRTHAHFFSSGLQQPKAEHSLPTPTASLLFSCKAHTHLQCWHDRRNFNCCGIGGGQAGSRDWRRQPPKQTRTPTPSCSFIDCLALLPCWRLAVASHKARMDAAYLLYRRCHRSLHAGLAPETARAPSRVECSGVAMLMQ